MVFFTMMFTTTDVNIHALIAKYGIDIQIVRPEMTKFKMFREFSKHGFLFCGNCIHRKDGNKHILIESKGTSTS
jgi:hypothetical protein